jgi:hypothetical protein
MKKALLLIFILVLFLLSACGKTEPAEVPAPAETPAPAEIHNQWLEELPWEEDWTCLLMAGRELEPILGKEALRTLLFNYDWALIDPEAADEEASFFDVDRAGMTLIYLPEQEWLRLRLEDNGDLTWNGTLRRPLGEGAGAKLLAEWNALAETGVSTISPPRLNLVSGEESVPANLHGTYSWFHITRMGRGMGCESDGVADYDWIGAGCPILAAEGPVSLDFTGEAPDRMSLSVYSDCGSAPLALRAESFTPLAGLHTYSLSCTWELEDPQAPGGSGSCTYILLIEGAEDLGPEPGDTENLTLTLREADAWGCTFALEKRGQGTCEPTRSLYTLLRRTDAGGWDWVEPIRSPYDGTKFSMTGDLTIENLAWEWSYTCGVLSPGEYRLQLGWTYGREKELWLTSADFTVTETEPEVPGPLTLCETPEGLECSLEQLSPHRWVQTLRLEGEGYGWRVDRDFDLFRMSENGTLTFIPPAYRLPAGLNEPFLRRMGWDMRLEADLAARYGDLEAGTYVIRRRALYLAAAEDLYREEGLLQTFRSWRLAPEDLVEYLDTVLILASPLSAPDLEAEPLDPFLYIGEALTFPVSTEEDWYSSKQAHVMLKTPVYADFPYDLEYNPKDYGLYFLEGEEWLPLKRQNYFRTRKLDEGRQEPGSTREEYISYDAVYADLEPGTYRLVLPATAYPRKEGLEQQEGYIVLQFRRTEEGDGIWEPSEE